MVDGNTNRNGLNKEADKLAEITGLPYFATAMGKGGPNEDLPNFGGTYMGGGSTEAVRKAVEDDSDLVLYLGSLRVRNIRAVETYNMLTLSADRYEHRRVH